MAAPTQIVFNENTYAGEVLAGYMAVSLLPKDGSAEKGLVTVHDNVKKKLTLRRMDDVVEFQNPSAKFVGQASPDIEIDERYLELVAYEVMKEYSFEDLWTSWQAEQLKPGALNDYDGTAEFTDWVMDRITEYIGIVNERLMWLGKAAAGYKGSTVTFSATYDGLIAKMKSRQRGYQTPCQHRHSRHYRHYYC